MKKPLLAPAALTGDTLPLSRPIVTLKSVFLWPAVTVTASTYVCESTVLMDVDVVTPLAVDASPKSDAAMPDTALSNVAVNVMSGPTTMEPDAPWDAEKVALGAEYLRRAHKGACGQHLSRYTHRTCAAVDTRT